MGFGVSLASSARNETLGISTGIGTTVTASGTAGVYGSLSTIGTTGFNYDGFYVDLGKSTTARRRITITANNGGSDQTIAEDLFLDGNGNGNGSYSVLCPIRVPSGSVIKAKTATSGSSITTYISVRGFQGDPKIVPGFSRIVSLTDFTTADPTNSITLTGNTLTGWSQVCASTQAEVCAVWAELDALGQSYGNTGITIDIGWGAAASETVLFRYPIKLNTTNSGCSGSGPMPCLLPVGSRLAARAQCSLNTVTQTIIPVLYGAVA